MGKVIHLTVSENFGGLEEKQVCFIELNYNEVINWDILLRNNTDTNSTNPFFQTDERSLNSLRYRVTEVHF